MQKLKTLVLAVMVFSFTSCATILGGKITDCQKTKPATGKRQVRVAALVIDIITGGIVWPAIDFATGAIYKPCK
jgi:hypothetical protein